jgi:imidazolonepropionase-like amidohydrolase
MKARLLCTLGVIALRLAPATALAQGDTYAIQGGTVHTLAGPAIERSTVVLQSGHITAVGPDVGIPDGATVIDATGQHVYPGLFNAFSQLGLREINAVTVTVDVQELGTFNPHLTASTAVHPASEHIPVTRANGITHVVSAPSARSGGIGGQASAIHLDGWTIEEMLIGQVGFVMNWPNLQTRSFDFRTFSVTTRSFDEAKQEYDKSVTELRGWFERARQYQRAVESEGAPVRDLRLETLGMALTGDLPLLVLADEARDIRNALDFAQDEGLALVLVGGRDAAVVKALLAERDVPVLLRATQNTPANRDDPYYAAFTTAAELHEAGVRFAMTGWASAGPNPPSRTLAYEAANAVKFGLPAAEALLAITRYPAEILGLGGDLGTIEVGKLGNLIVTDGDPLQIRTQVLHVFINGHPVSLENKHHELYEKYRARR